MNVEKRTPWQKLMDTPPVVIDGGTFVLIGFLNAIASGLGNDEAAKFIGDVTLFYLRIACSATLQALLALKMFRSTGFAKAQQDKEIAKREETAFFRKPEDPKIPGP